uniref:Phosphoribosylaminoimidazole carboxylase n=1 Tax=Gongylonema pulchrum TaxID=637853 RepID=A0A183CX22_9BILA
LSQNEQAVLSGLDECKIALSETGEKKNIYKINSLPNVSDFFHSESTLLCYRNLLRLLQYVLVRCAHGDRCDKGILCYLRFVGLENAFVQHGIGPMDYVAHRCKTFPYAWIVKRVPLSSERYSAPMITATKKVGTKKYVTTNDTHLLTRLPKVSGFCAKMDILDEIKRQCDLIFRILEKFALNQCAKLEQLRIKFGVNDETVGHLMAYLLELHPQIPKTADCSDILQAHAFNRLLLTEALSNEICFMASEKNKQDVEPKLSVQLQDLTFNDSPQTNKRLVVLLDSESNSSMSKDACEVADEFGIQVEWRRISMCYAFELLLEIISEYDQEGMATIFVAYDEGKHALAKGVASRTAAPVISVLNSEGEFPGVYRLKNDLSGSNYYHLRV